MHTDLSRRHFFGLLGAGLAAPLLRGSAAGPARAFRIRTITAGLELKRATDLERVRSAIDFLEGARRDFVTAGYPVQTVRVATQSLARYLPRWGGAGALEALEALDRLAKKRGAILSVGPVIEGDGNPADFASFAAALIRRTSQISLTVRVASPEHGIHHRTVRAAAETMAALADARPGGVGNFRFAATAFAPAGTPFFPAAYHAGPDAFSIGLESPGLLQEAFQGTRGMEEAKRRLRARMESALGPVEKLARGLAQRSGRRYLGIDVSPAPGLDASIGRAIETLTGVPFGSPSTLAACAAITDVLRNLPVMTCGYSGLMLPVLEDPVLARRAAEGRYGVSELLLYSSVCGTGLDVVPLAGDVSIRALAAAIGDVAALATKYQKPLSARLLPVPGRKAGQPVHLDNPFLTDSIAMNLGV